VHVSGDPEALTTWVSLNPNVTMLEAHKRGGRLSFTVDDPEALGAHLKRMVGDGVAVVEFHRESRKLEDAFVDMLKKE